MLTAAIVITGIVVIAAIAACVLAGRIDCDPQWGTAPDEFAPFLMPDAHDLPEPAPPRRAPPILTLVKP